MGEGVRVCVGGEGCSVLSGPLWVNICLGQLKFKSIMTLVQKAPQVRPWGQRANHARTKLRRNTCGECDDKPNRMCVRSHTATPLIGWLLLPASDTTSSQGVKEQTALDKVEHEHTKDNM